MHRILTSLSAFAAIILTTVLFAEDTTDSTKIEFFEKHVRPILANNCYNCHSANTNSKGGLRVDDGRGLINGGNRGSAIVPGDPESSLLIQAIRYQDKDLKMPPGKQLPEEQIAVLESWIKDGAVWPQEALPDDIGEDNKDYEDLRKNHWAWQPVRTSRAPDVKQAEWVRGDIDRYVLAALESKGLKFVADADKVQLIRRITFDLTGLPPTPEEIENFLADDSSGAFEKVVDRLLASQAFGEHWGRHWLDVARYGESTGSSRNVPYPHAWRYRDYVLAAFNADKPYDKFIQEQIAGDLLSAASEVQRQEQLVATGFLAIGVKDVNQRFKVRFIMDNIDEQIDTVTRSVLGLTASCARCHDHKFDPIPTNDYYALAGIFESTDICAGVRNKMGGGGLDYYDPKALVVLSESSTKPDLEHAAKIEAAQAALAEARANFEALKDSPAGAELAPNGKPKKQVARNRMNKLQGELNALQDPAAVGTVCLGVREGVAHDADIRIRGEAEKHGPAVSRGFLSVVKFPDAPQVNAEQSGRLELAQWLTHPNNPLTPRVMTNRVWQHLFGRGLVSSVDNFGSTGDVPTHPELLDYLSGEFVKNGWSVKQLVRQIVLSRTYQLSSSALAENVALDPANKLLWRHNPRRLTAEEIRDSMLAASLQLDRTPLTPSPAQQLKVIEIRNNGAEARSLDEFARQNLQRSVYLPLLRGLTPTSLSTFDFAEQGMVTGSRDVTTVAPQALYLLNDVFVRKQALGVGNRLLAANTDDLQRLQRLYVSILGRSPTNDELVRGIRFLATFEADYDRLGGKDFKPQAEVALAAAPKPEEPTSNAKPIDPDEVITPDAPIREEAIVPTNAREAAWASFTQALFGSAEFRYVR